LRSNYSVCIQSNGAQIGNIAIGLTLVRNGIAQPICRTNWHNSIQRDDENSDNGKKIIVKKCAVTCWFRRVVRSVVAWRTEKALIQPILELMNTQILETKQLLSEWRCYPRICLERLGDRPQSTWQRGSRLARRQGFGRRQPWTSWRLQPVQQFLCRNCEKP
jgi:hypothetical protein